jgi:hypothetical protein
MPLKLSVGTSRKLGLPNYSSIGASCHLEVELDGALITRGPEDLQRHIRRAYAACRQAVLDELARSRYDQEQNGAQAPPSTLGGRAASPANDHSKLAPNGRQSSASRRQLDYIEQLFAEVGGAESCPLAALVHRLYERPPQELTAGEASELIETLQAIRNGEVNLDEILATEAA